MAELKNKIVYQLLLSASQVLLPLVTWPYITRVLGPGNLGKVNFVDSVSQMFIIVAAFGIPYYAVREISIVRNDQTKRSLLVRELILLQSVFAVIAALLFTLFTLQQWKADPLLYLLGLSNILISSFSYDWYINGMEHFKFAAIRTIFARVLMLFCFFILVNTSSDYENYYAIFSFGMLVTAFINASKIVKENNALSAGLQFKKHLIPLWHFFVTSSAITIYVYFDTVLLQYLTGNEQEVGFYTTALKIVKVFLAIIIALSTVLFPRLSHMASENKMQEITAFLNRYLSMIITAGFPACTALFVLAPEIVNVIAGNMFSPAVPLMRILSFMPIIIALSNMFCFQVLMPFKKEKKFLYAVITGCIVSVLLNLGLIPAFNAKGAAYASVFTELLVTTLSGIMAYKVARWSINTLILWQTLVAALLILPLAFVSRLLFSSPLIILCSTLSFFAVFYFILQYKIFKNSVITEAIDYFQNLIKR